MGASGDDLQKQIREQEAQRAANRANAARAQRVATITAARETVPFLRGRPAATQSRNLGGAEFESSDFIVSSNTRRPGDLDYAIGRRNERLANTPVPLPPLPEAPDAPRGSAAWLAYEVDLRAAQDERIRAIVQQGQARGGARGPRSRGRGGRASSDTRTPEQIIATAGRALRQREDEGFAEEHRRGRTGTGAFAALTNIPGVQAALTDLSETGAAIHKGSRSGSSLRDGRGGFPGLIRVAQALQPRASRGRPV